MSAYFESVNLKGFANWMRVQAEEELMHALKFYDYIAEMGGRITLSSIEEPSSEWGSPLKVFQHVYEHEQKVTGLIHDLVSLAISEKDQATNSFLQWFVKEQVEEEESASEVVEKLNLQVTLLIVYLNLTVNSVSECSLPQLQKKGAD